MSSVNLESVPLEVGVLAKTRQNHCIRFQTKTVLSVCGLSPPKT